MNVGDSTESVLIQRIRERTGATAPGVTLGIGDDAAVLQPVRGRSEVMTTDTLVEGVHFRRDWSDAQAIGRKAVLVNLSDLAAMGATPRALLLSLSLPPSLPLADFDALIDGVLAEALAAKAALVGGNITASPGALVVTVTATGTVHPRRVLRRDGGRPGHALYVTGAVGGAAAGLEILSSGIDRRTLSAGPALCVARYEIPPQLAGLARKVAGYRAASACIDLSDGLADAVRQLAESSGTGASIDGGAIPVDESAAAWWSSTGARALNRAIAGGEDYELLFAVPSKKRRGFLAAAADAGDIRVTRIGELIAGTDCVISQGEDVQPLPSGFSHFGSK